MTSLRLESVTRRVGSELVLDAVDLEVGDGELVALLGPSGSGKTSILRAIAGLDRLTRGRVLISGVDMTETPVPERDIGMVHQSNVLLPMRTARGNVAFPLRVRDVNPNEIDDRVRAESRAHQIEEIIDRWPRELSEGHQQLVQIARAMVRPPRVFLLDEPLARLDPPTRLRLRRELRRLQSGYGVAMVYATNDPEEAMAIADRVAVVDRGRIVQVADPETLWRDPANLLVAELTGPLGLIEVTVERDGRAFWLTAPGTRLRAWAPALSQATDRRAIVGVRSDAIRLDPKGPVAGTIGPLLLGTRRGRVLLVGDARLTIHLDRALAEGADVSVAFDRWHVFQKTGEKICSVG